MKIAKFINKYTKTGFFKFNEQKYTFDAVFETSDEDLIMFLQDSSGFEYIGDKEEERSWFKKSDKKEKVEKKEKKLKKKKSEE